MKRVHCWQKTALCVLVLLLLSACAAQPAWLSDYKVQDGEFVCAKARWGAPFDEAAKALGISEESFLSEAPGSQRFYQASGELTYEGARVTGGYVFTEGLFSCAEYKFTYRGAAKDGDIGALLADVAAKCEKAFGKPTSDETTQIAALNNLENRTILWKGPVRGDGTYTYAVIMASNDKGALPTSFSLSIGLYKKPTA